MDKEIKNISKEMALLTKTIFVIIGAYLSIAGLVFVVTAVVLFFEDSGIISGYAPLYLILGLILMFLSLLPIISFFKLKNQHSIYIHLGMALVSLLIAFFVFRFLKL